LTSGRGRRTPLARPSGLSEHVKTFAKQQTPCLRLTDVAGAKFARHRLDAIAARQHPAREAQAGEAVPIFERAFDRAKPRGGRGAGRRQHIAELAAVNFWPPPIDRIDGAYRRLIHKLLIGAGGTVLRLVDLMPGVHPAGGVAAQVHHRGDQRPAPRWCRP
jgi:hypothetical protein